MKAGIKRLALFIFILALAGSAYAARSPRLEIISRDKELSLAVRQNADSFIPRLNLLIGASPKSIKIVVASSKEEFRRLAEELKGPDWAAGLAIPSRNLILLRSPGQLIDPGGFGSLIAHELLHLYFHSALGGQKAPLWLEEGLAMHISGESSLGRAWSMSQAVLMGDLIPFERLNHIFPAEASKARLAYAQSYYFVAFLLDQYGPGTTAGILEGLAQGRDLSGILHDLTGKGLVGLEKQFQEAMSSRFSWLMVLFSGSVLWGLAALVAAVGLVLRRRAQLKERRLAPDPVPLVGVYGPIRKWPPPQKPGATLKEAGLASKTPQATGRNQS